MDLSAARSRLRPIGEETVGIVVVGIANEPEALGAPVAVVKPPPQSGGNGSILLGDDERDRSGKSGKIRLGVESRSTATTGREPTGNGRERLRPAS